MVELAFGLCGLLAVISWGYAAWLLRENARLRENEAAASQIIEHLTKKGYEQALQDVRFWASRPSVDDDGKARYDA